MICLDISTAIEAAIGKNRQNYFPQNRDFFYLLKYLTS